jgi:hypothetical protein
MGFEPTTLHGKQIKGVRVSASCPESRRRSSTFSPRVA